jgi:hypothetical protein
LLLISFKLTHWFIVYLFFSSRGRRPPPRRDPALGAGWGETGGQDRFSKSKTSQFSDYPQEGGEVDYDRGDRGQPNFDNRQSNIRGSRDRFDPSSGSGGRERYQPGYDGYEDDSMPVDEYDDSRRRGPRKGLIGRSGDDNREYYDSSSHGPDVRGDDSMERFRQGKDVQKGDLYSVDVSSTASNKKKIRSKSNMGGTRRGNSNNEQRRRRPSNEIREGPSSINNSSRRGSSSPPSSRGDRRGGGGVGGGGRRGGNGKNGDRGFSLDDLNEML